FPAKWMSGDGRTLHLVFSGDDNFSVRKATLVLFDTSAKSGAELDHADISRSPALELQQALEKAPVLRTESLGEPARGVNVWERWFVPNRTARPGTCCKS